MDRKEQVANRRADRIVHALELAWRRSGGVGPHPGFDHKPYVGMTPREAFQRALDTGSINQLAMLRGLAVKKLK